jgi:hypothetical protein
MNDRASWTIQDWPRLGVTIAILGAFAWALVWHYSSGLEETLKNLAVMAVGFWLGSSRGAQTQTENVGKALDLANTNSPTTPPDVVLKPGETAQAEQQI